MKESLILFETAKLAKEKGFDWSVRNFYPDTSWNSKKLFHCVNVGYHFTNEILNDDPNGFGDIILAPTQSLLQKWLRQEKGINLFIDCIGLGEKTFWYFIYYKREGKESVIEQDGEYTYEEALEAGLIQSLKLI